MAKASSKSEPSESSPLGKISSYTAPIALSIDGSGPTDARSKRSISPELSQKDQATHEGVGDDAHVLQEVQS